MARCPTCHRRIPPESGCPADGGVAPAEGLALVPTPPSVWGFEIRRLLGVGGFGAVWEAVPDAGGGPAAIKVAHASDADSLRRLGREADALERVGPPHAPALLGRGGLDDGRPYLVMELLRGRLLSDEMAEWTGPPGLAVVRSYAEALLESAAAVAQAGLIHCDLKPENVFLVRTGDQLSVRLMDFGLAVPAPAEAEHRQAGAGTPEYMAPEQIGGRTLELACDVYALGLMLYELYTLRLPFAGEARELEYSHLSLRPPRPSRLVPLPAAVEEVILRCLSKDPTMRYADALALRVAFREAHALPAQAESTEISTTTSNRKKPGTRGGERQKVAVVFAQGEPFSPVEVQAALQPFGGQLAHVGRGQGACAFAHRAGDNPGPRALAAAEALLAKGLATRVIIDLVSVTVKVRPDGPPSLIGSALSQSARYPTAADPEGILIAAAARTLVPVAVGAPAPGRPDHFLVAESSDEDRTRTRPDLATGLVGRDGPLRALLDDAGTAVRERRPRVASVLADPGLGKTRVAAELSQLLRVKVPAARVIELRGREPLGNAADETLADLLRRTLHLPSAPPADGGRSLLGELLGAHAHDSDSYAAAALLLGWIGADHPAVQALRAAPGVLRANAARAGMEALKRLAAQDPVLVVLDDAHWADDALLDALEQASVSELPLWVVAFGRPSFAERRPSWGRRAAHAETVTLGPLDPASAALLFRQLLQPATSVPEPVITRLVDRTQGVPLLMCDLVRGLRREGLVREQAGGVWYVATEVLDKLPDSPLVEWLSERELSELPPELAAHARLVSLLAPEVTAREVEGAIGEMPGSLAETFPMDAGVAMARLREARILLQHRSGRFSYRTGVMREVVASTVPPARATDIHKAALAYYRLAPLADSTRLPRLAWHAARAGERHESALAYLAVAEAARERHNYLEADLDYTRALEQIDQIDAGDLEARLRAFKGRGTMRYRLGRHDGSLADLAQARELAVKNGDALIEADVLLDESMALDWLFEWRRSRELAERARELVTAHPHPLLEAKALLAVGRSYQRFNQDREAAELLRQAARAAERLGDDGYEVRMIADLMLGFLLPFLGLLDEAEVCLDRANAMCEEKGDELHQAVVWMNRACLWIARNDRDRFMDDNGRMLAYARRMGNANLERGGNLNSAYFLYWRGEFEAAIPFAQRAIEIDERYFHQGGFRPDAAVLLARILWGAGRDQESRKLVDEVRRHQETARAAGQNELLLQPNDAMLLDMITLVLARGDAGAWEALMERGRSVAQGQELIEALEVAGVSALARADADAARRWWREALQAGERIPNVMAGRIRERLARLG